jgi:hypothetical protein
MTIRPRPETPPPLPDDEAQIRWLRTPEAVRRRCKRVLELGEKARLSHFKLHASRLGELADTVVEVTRAAYPALDMPVYGRWGHFDAAGVRRTDELETALGSLTTDERARAMIDLVVVSVLLDASAGPTWRYHEAPGRSHVAGDYQRSEGLAIASLRMFLSGGFSSDPRAPLRADADGLSRLTRERLAAGLQASEKNPLAGIDDRLELLHDLGRSLPRPGVLYDRIRARAHGDTVHAAAVMAELVTALTPVWPGRTLLAGQELGDVWPLALLAPPPAPLSQRLVPFHSPMQWLTYSMVAPLAAAGLEVIALGELTGLADHRNGGLFIDGGVLELRDPVAATCPHQLGDELIVEWRACTVGLLDRLATLVRQRLGLDEAQLPIGRIIQGGTWQVGRRLAAWKRPGGEPPLIVETEGPLF